MLSTVRIGLAIVFLVSGVSKLLSTEDAKNFISDVLHIDISTAHLVVILLSLCEIAIGVLLFSGKWAAVLSFVSSLFFLASLIVGVSYFGEDKSCGCFGILVDSKVDDIFIVRNALLMVLSIFLLRSSLIQQTEDAL